MADNVQDRAIELWEHHGVRCAIAIGGSVCGYVQLPDNHPWRIVADAERAVMLAAGGTFYYDDNPELPFTQQITYGPDEHGWVGFDTSHYNDVWAADDLPAPLADKNRLLIETFKIAGLDDEAITNLLRLQPAAGARTWTMPRMRAAVNQLAEHASAPAQGVTEERS